MKNREYCFEKKFDILDSANIRMKMSGVVISRTMYQFADRAVTLRFMIITARNYEYNTKYKNK